MTPAPYYDRLDILSIAHACDEVVARASANDKDWRLSESLLELVACNLIDVPLETLKTALVIAGYDYRLPPFRQAHSALIDAIQREDQDSAYYLTKQLYRMVVR